MLTEVDFRRWLARYGAAWEQRDPAAAAALFTEQAEYYWTPMAPPKRGRAEIARAWAEATSRQTDVRFTFEVLAVDGLLGIASWHTRLVRPATDRTVDIDGVLTAAFDASGRCGVFREWWHSSELESGAA